MCVGGWGGGKGGGLHFFFNPEAHKNIHTKLHQRCKKKYNSVRVQSMKITEGTHDLGVFPPAPVIPLLNIFPMLIATVQT